MKIGLLTLIAVQLRGEEREPFVYRFVSFLASFSQPKLIRRHLNTRLLQPLPSVDCCHRFESVVRLFVVVAASERSVALVCVRRCQEI